MIKEIKFKLYLHNSKQSILMNKIHAIFLADSHLGYDHPLKPRSERKRRGEDFFRKFELILDRTLMIKPDFLIHGGDLFDNPYVNQSLVNRAYFKLFELAEAGIPVFIVPGNHERAKLSTSIYLQHPNIFIFSEAKTFHIKCREHKISISGFPYYYGDIRSDFSMLQKKLVSKLTPGSLNIMCLHQIVEGAQVGRQNYTFRYNKDVIKLEDLTNDYVCYLSGHIHRHQIIRNTINNVPFIYPGSIERTSFQESDEVKGYCQLSFSETEMKYDMEYKFIELDSRPMETLEFEEKIYSENEVKDLILSKVKKISSNAVLRYKSEYPENLYKITSKLEKELIPSSISIQKGINYNRRKRTD